MTDMFAAPEIEVPRGIIVGDNREILRKFPDSSFHLAITDPPYNIGLEYHDAYNDKQKKNEFLDFIRDVMAENYRVLKPNGSLFLFMGSWLQAECKIILEEDIGFHWRRTICWHNTFGQAQKGNFTPSWTAIHYVTKSADQYTWNADAIRVPSQRQLRYNDKRANKSGKLPDDVWVLMPDVQHPAAFDERGDLWLQSRVCGTFKERKGHVTQLPLPIVERMVKVASNPGDLVLDSFAGTGTVLVAAEKLGRIGVGIELSPDTAKIAEGRLRAEVKA